VIPTRSESDRRWLDLDPIRSSSSWIDDADFWSLNPHP
jgi:hypothetical protein